MSKKMTSRLAKRSKILCKPVVSNLIRDSLCGECKKGLENPCSRINGMVNGKKRKNRPSEEIIDMAKDMEIVVDLNESKKASDKPQNLEKAGNLKKIVTLLPSHLPIKTEPKEPKEPKEPMIRQPRMNMNRIRRKSQALLEAEADGEISIDVLELKQQDRSDHQMNQSEKQQLQLQQKQKHMTLTPPVKPSTHPFLVSSPEDSEDEDEDKDKKNDLCVDQKTILHIDVCADMSPRMAMSPRFISPFNSNNNECWEESLLPPMEELTRPQLPMQQQSPSPSQTPTPSRFNCSLAAGEMTIYTPHCPQSPQSPQSLLEHQFNSPSCVDHYNNHHHHHHHHHHQTESSQYQQEDQLKVVTPRSVTGLACQFFFNSITSDINAAQTDR
jgi:hypothetical protein